LRYDITSLYKEVSLYIQGPLLAVLSHTGCALQRPLWRGIVTRVGDETTGKMWSLYDSQNVLKFLEGQKRSLKCQLKK